MNRILRKKIAISLLICLLALTVLGGCSSDTEEALQGTWKLQQMLGKDGKATDIKDYAKQLGLDINRVQSIFEFKDDGKVTATLGGTARAGKYTVDGDEVSIKVGDSKYDLKYDGTDTLTTKKSKEPSGLQLVFKKE